MRFVAGVLCVLMAAPMVRADAIGELRVTLGRMAAKQPVRATVALETHSRTDDRDDKPYFGKATFDAEHGAEGLRVTYTPEMIARAQQEARAQDTDPEKPTPTRSAMRDVDPEQLMELLDAGAMLTRQLGRAKLLKDQKISIGGRPVRQLTMALDPKLSKSDAKRVKSFTLTLVVNLDEAGVPLSAELRQAVKAKVLVVSFQQDQTVGYTFGRNGDRLVAVRRHERSSGSGLGQKFENSKLMTLALR